MDWIAVAKTAAFIVGTFGFFGLVVWLINVGTDIDIAMEDRGWPKLIAHTVGISIAIGWLVYPAFVCAAYVLYLLFSGQI